MCGAPGQETLPAGEVGAGQAVLHGHLLRAGAGVAGAYVRLLDRTGEFTAEVQTSATGYFRFYAAPGEWTVRTLLPKQTVDTPVTAVSGQAVQATVEVPA